MRSNELVKIIAVVKMNKFEIRKALKALGPNEMNEDRAIENLSKAEGWDSVNTFFRKIVLYQLVRDGYVYLLDQDSFKVEKIRYEHRAKPLEMFPI
jgi:hypothetical protein